MGSWWEHRLPFAEISAKQTGQKIEGQSKKEGGGEHSPDAGGLLRWPVRLLIPLGFTLLGLQGLAELMRRITVLRGTAMPATESRVEPV